MRKIETIVYTIDEHPDPEACYDYVRNNWHDLGVHYVEDAVNTLKELAKQCGYEVDYALCIHPERGEGVTFNRKHGWPDDRKAKEAFLPRDLEGNCPLTGTGYDETCLDVFRERPEEGLIEVLNEAAERLLETLHEDGRWIYSDQGIHEMLEANEYEFYETGEVL